MHVTILGAGYVGLITAVCLAEFSHSVICLDIDEEKIKMLSQGIPPLYERGLEEMLKRHLQEGNLSFTTNIQEATLRSTVYMIAVPTPSLPDGSCDLSFVLKAATSIAPKMTEGSTIIMKSTTPPGTALQIKALIQSRLPSHVSFDVISNPEFLREGSAIQDCLHPDRIILGVDNERSLKTALKLYHPLALSQDKWLVMSPSSAEMTKYAANAMLATKISFINEIANLCERIGANVSDVKKGISADHRIGPHFLNAGAGYGGSCFPKDVKALVALGKQFGYSPSLLEEVDAVNQRQKEVMFHKIKSYFSSKGGVTGKTIGILGLAFKPHTDDLRESPSLTLIQQLLDHGALLRLYDPIAILKAKHVLQSPLITWCEDEYECALTSHAIVLMTEWPQFYTCDCSLILAQMQGSAFFDGRNVFEGEKMRSLGFDYHGIGTPSSLLVETVSIS
ncbi:UDP-glucose dehydrogenase family protein [Rhabdochlamydiaceae symbiont of Dictyostelium giganteum]|uniref:UDP-glucose dehydrogenase family protein n=1 Tax=Rhabdochlamydiaceae symbiont of Dictyostelium giganteum TaxID=3342349 RepID=UPI00384BE7E8